MQENARKAMKNAALFASAPPSPMPGVNGVDRYTGRQFEYFEEPTSQYIWENSKYASNYFKAQVQGIIPGSFDTERGAHIRSMDIVEQTTGAKMPNDYQSIYFEDTRIKGLYTGAKVKYAGNTWLAISPFNIADPLSSAVIRRCNAVWRHLDYYGNVITEPFIFHDGRASATANEYLDWSVIPNWYQKCVMQLNESTRELAYNRRIILGSSAVEVRGLVDFVTDFTGETRCETENAEPSHVMFFDVQFQPPLDIDDMERGIAGGKAFSWIIKPSYSGQMSVGDAQAITATSIRNGEEADTEKHPVSYLFYSSDDGIVSVDENGIATAISEGVATISVVLEQNQEIEATIEITVSEEELQPQFVFTPELPTRMKQIQEYTGIVSIMRGGNEIGGSITVEPYGATEAASVTFDAGSRRLTIHSYEPSDIPLSLVFKANEYNLTLTKQIKLEGF